MFPNETIWKVPETLVCMMGQHWPRWGNCMQHGERVQTNVIQAGWQTTVSVTLFGTQEKTVVVKNQEFELYINFQTAQVSLIPQRGLEHTATKVIFFNIIDLLQ